MSILNAEDKFSEGKNKMTDIIQSYYDSVTKLPNRLLFMECLNWAMNEAKRHQDNLAILNIELDNFDRIIETMGLNAGDEVLRLIAPRIERVIRNSDFLGHFITDEDKIMHLFRGECSEFSFLMDRIDNPESAAIVSERIIKAIKAPFPLEHIEVHLTASIGIATFPADSQDYTELLQLASDAKNDAKNKGGDCFRFSSSRVNESYIERRNLGSRLKKSMEKDELVLHYQPKVDINKGDIKSVEALLRWNNGESGLISPDDFIPLAEETGVIIPMGEWVIYQACKQISEWHKTDRVPVSMSVNLSAVQFRDPDFFP